MLPSEAHSLTLNQQSAHLRRWAARIETSSFLVKEVAERLFERLDLMKLLPDRLLDLGHPFYSLSPLLQKRYPSAFLLTYNPFVTPKKRARWFRRSVTDNVIHAERTRLPLADESLDLVIAHNVIASSQERRHLWDECYRLLKPEGLLLFSTFGPDTLKEWREAEQSFSDYIPSPFSDMHDIGDELLAKGFADPVIDRESLTIFYAHFAVLLKDLRANNLSFRKKKYLSRAYVNHMQQAYSAHLSPEGHLPMTAEILYGHAWKVPKRNKEQGNEVSIPLTAIKKSK